MSVPDHRDIPQKLFATGLYDLKSHDGHDAFTDAVVATLNGRDKNWRHLKKRADQTHVHRHGEDSALYLLPNGEARAVDFISGAGGPNPQPGWLVDSFPYKHSDAHDPDDHGIGGASQPQPPMYPPYPPNESDVDGAGVALFADFALALQAPNPQMFRFAFRVAYSWLTKEVVDLPASVAKHRKEWRALLGLP